VVKTTAKKRVTVQLASCGTHIIRRHIGKK
jgi:hypothetical protein